MITTVSTQNSTVILWTKRNEIGMYEWMENVEKFGLFGIYYVRHIGISLHARRFGKWKAVIIRN